MQEVESRASCYRFPFFDTKSRPRMSVCHFCVLVHFGLCVSVCVGLGLLDDRHNATKRSKTSKKCHLVISDSAAGKENVTRHRYVLDTFLL